MNVTSTGGIPQPASILSLCFALSILHCIFPAVLTSGATAGLWLTATTLLPPGRGIVFIEVFVTHLKIPCSPADNSVLI